MQKFVVIPSHDYECLKIYRDHVKRLTNHNNPAVRATINEISHKQREVFRKRRLIIDLENDIQQEETDIFLMQGRLIEYLSEGL